jgi:endonuclease/exonuclease/phosphatase family metal-dependent hydrolase
MMNVRKSINTNRSKSMRWLLMFTVALTLMGMNEPLSANEPLRLRVLSYNIHHGEGVDGRLDLPRIANVIREVNPDLVSLQEVDQNVARTNHIDQAKELSRLLGMQVAFGGNIDLQGGKYGNAVLSRMDIARHQNHLLPNTHGGEQRGVLAVELNLPTVEERLLFLATHFDHRRDEQQRLDSSQAINELLQEYPGRIALLVGDLNATPDSQTLAILQQRWRLANEQALPTIPVEKPTRQIDFILFYPSDRWRVIETKVLDEAVASDHRPLLSVLELSPR